MTQKDVALYYYAKMFLQNILKKYFISKSFQNSLTNEEHWI